MPRPKKPTRSKWYIVSYPDPAAREIRMKIFTDQLNLAERGSKAAQNAICLRYKAANGNNLKNIPVWWTGLHPNIRPDKDQTDREEPLTTKMQRPVDECHCECQRCDIGYHCHNPRNGCKLHR